MIVVPDTNVLISGFAYPGSIPGKIITAWRLRNIEFALSEFILDEFKRVLPTISCVSMSQAEITELTDLLRFLSDIVVPEACNETVRDANDRLILGTLVSANADYLITGDKDLLEFKNMFPIITPRGFWDRHGE